MMESGKANWIWSIDLNNSQLQRIIGVNTVHTLAALDKENLLPGTVRLMLDEPDAPTYKPHDEVKEELETLLISTELLCDRHVFDLINYYKTNIEPYLEGVE